MTTRTATAIYRPPVATGRRHRHRRRWRCFDFLSGNFISFDSPFRFDWVPTGQARRDAAQRCHL